MSHPRALRLAPALVPALYACLMATGAAAQDEAEAAPSTPAFTDGPYCGCGMDGGFWAIAPEELAVLYPAGVDREAADEPTVNAPEGLALLCACVADIDGDGQSETVGAIGTPLEGDFPISEHVSLVVLEDGGAEPVAVTDPIQANGYEEAYSGMHLFVADVDADGEPEILLRGWTAGASARPTTVTVFRPVADGTALEALGQATGEIDVVIADLDGDGAPEFVGGGSIGWEIPHVCAPRWTTIWSMRDGALVDVSASFPDQAGAPLEEFEALFALEDLDADPRKDCEIAYHMGLRCELDQEPKKAVPWYKTARAAYAAAIKEWKDLMPDDEPTFLLERQAAVERRLAELEG